MFSRKFFYLFPLLILCSFMTEGSVVAQAATEIVATNVAGKVVVDRGRGSKRVEPGMKFKADDRIRTIGRSSVDLVWNEKVGYRLLNSSECLITEIGHETLHFEMISGNIVLNIESLKPGSELKLKTPTAVATVRGTQFFASLINAITTFVVRQGIVEVLMGTLSGSPVEVGAGQALDVSSTTTQPQVRAATTDELRTAAQADSIPTAVNPDQNFAPFDNVQNTTPPAQQKSGDVDTNALHSNSVGQPGDREGDPGDSGY